jgi:hypothetical protein
MYEETCQTTYGEECKNEEQCDTVYETACEDVKPDYGVPPPYSVTPLPPPGYVNGIKKRRVARPHNQRQSNRNSG